MRYTITSKINDQFVQYLRMILYDANIILNRAYYVVTLQVSLSARMLKNFLLLLKDEIHNNYPDSK